MRVRQLGDADLTQQESVLLEVVARTVESYRAELAVRGVTPLAPEIRWIDAQTADCIQEFQVDGQFHTQVDFPAIDGGAFALSLDQVVETVTRGLESQLIGRQARA